MILFKLSRQQHRTFEILVAGLVMVFSVSGFLLLWSQDPTSSSETSLHSDIALFSSIKPQRALWLRFLYDLHTHFLIGPFGSLLVCLSGFAILTVSITGMRRWVGWKRPKQGFRIRRTLNSRMLLFDIHNALGAIAFLFLLLIGISGSLLSLGSLLKILGITYTEEIASMLTSLMLLAETLHKASYQSDIALRIYSLFAISIILIAVTGMTMGIRNIYRKYKSSFL